MASCSVLKIRVSPIAAVTPCPSRSDRKYELTREDHVDPLAAQIVEQIAHGLRGGIVNIRYRACVDDEPTNRRPRAFHKGANFADEAVVIRVKQICAEPIDDQHEFGLLAWRRGGRRHRPVAFGASIIVCGR